MKDWRVRQLHEDGDLKVQVVESIRRETCTFPRGGYAWIIVEPEAVVVSARDGQCAFDMQGNPIGMDALTERVGDMLAIRPG